MLRSTPVLVLLLTVLLAGPAEASWALQHLSRAWSGGLTIVEVEQLKEGIDEIDPNSTDGYWTLLLLAVEADARGASSESCSFVARFDGVSKRKKDLRLNVLRAACRLEVGELEQARKLAASSARTIRATEPPDYTGMLLRAEQIAALSAVGLWKAEPDSKRRRGHAEKAVLSWEESARLHRDGQGLIEAMAWRAELEG